MESDKIHTIVSLSEETQETILSIVKLAQANADAATELAVQAAIFAESAHADNVAAQQQMFWATVIIGAFMIATGIYAAIKK